MMKLTLLGSATLASLLLVGCGSGDSTTDTTLSTTTGYVVDARVQNMNYDCVADGETDKVTGADGAFTCQNMSQVRFRLGNLVLGEISALPKDGLVFPQDIAGVNRADLYNKKVTAMAQLLQSLDEDDNLDNGIQIPQNAETVFENEDFDADNVDQYMDQASVQQKRTRTEAREHLRKTMREHNVPMDDAGFDINNFPMSTLTPELEETIIYMGNEERLAYDVYTYLYNYHMENSGTEIKQLFNIANKSETKHIEIVQSIVHRYNLDASTIISDPVADSSVTLSDMPSGEYGVPAIQALYDELSEKGIHSKQDALEVGCKVEVIDVDDLDADIKLAQEADAEDIVAAYEVLRDGSYTHYWAFDKGLKNMGIEEGCCSLGSDYCHPEYPQR